MNRLLMVCVLVMSPLFFLFSQIDSEDTRSTDFELLNRLRAAGIWDACFELKINFNEVFGPLVSEVDHPYRRYRWSVSHDAHGGVMINALPPEEELGWTPWERWSLVNGKPVRTEWVKYPLKETLKSGVVHWYKLSSAETLTPRFLKDVSDFEGQLRLARVDVASDWLGIDFEKTFLYTLSPDIQKLYQQYRWVVIPHILAFDGPVIYGLPPMDKSDYWPWESWYTDGKTQSIHHVHYTEKSALTKGVWFERAGAPQRPPEIFEYQWYWYDDKDMSPALSGKH